MPSNPSNSNFNRGDQTNEVVCPLKNNDGSSCRKRCLGDKRYRSMQEHIRRAHPEHYIPKLPATEESFTLMVNSSPRPPSQQQQQSNHSHSPANVVSAGQAGAFYQHGVLNLPPVSTSSPLLMAALGGPLDYSGNSTTFKHEFNYNPLPPRTTEDLRRASLLPAANAAEVLAQLHHQRPELSWEQEHYAPDGFEDSIVGGHRHAQLDPPTDPRLLGHDDRYSGGESIRGNLLPSTMAKSPPYHRSSTLPPAGRLPKPNRPRKSSITQGSRKPRHERKTSKDNVRRMSFDRKAMSAEPSSVSAFGKRWEDLIDAAASANEEDSRDMTPIPGSPHTRQSLPPLLLAPHFQNHHSSQHTHQTYAASPLQRALTPPPATTVAPEMHAFPSVESSVTSSKSGGTAPGTGNSAVSGSQFHMSAQGLLSDSSPTYSHHQSTQGLQGSHPVQIYCAGCQRLSILSQSYACTECICGLCKDCVDAISSEQGRGRMAGCPRCGGIGGRFKPFQLDIR